ncbi:AAA-like domain-containing protein [Vibrio sp. 10N.261.55.A7]|uniref:AAA-like domain-containing protein n=1 Tax=Vibrio sp. 10N.261.55.A7 TaxID=1880851 RepID=UPI000C83806E|nr:AAA-like domain-containing protein [Vibrio sp. 10N.261.55.A7]
MHPRYQIGGSVANDSSFYLKRQADETLYQHLMEGDVCYVFNSRQMGKSSLLLSVKKRLQEQSVRCCFIDMSRIGSVNVTIEQWYAGIISELWRGFELPTGRAMVEWWQGLGELPASQKLSIFLEHELIEKHPNQSFCLFFDEIDSVLSLPFAADDLFTLIRAFFNKRADDPRFNSLNFAFFGVAQPSDFITDSRRSPFNIGKAIGLEGFSYDEATPLIQGFPNHNLDNAKLLERILHWSNGQPFVTQKICQLVAQSDPEIGDEYLWIDTLVQKNIIDNWRSQDNPEHLKTIADRLLLDEQYSVQLLNSYFQVIENPNHIFKQTEIHGFERLYLTGLLANSNGAITARTKIYQIIFDQLWVTKQLDRHRPYAKKLNLWIESNQEDEQWLLDNTALEQARSWANDKHLPEEDHRFFAASQDKISAEIQSWNSRLQSEVTQRKAAEEALQQALEELQIAKNEAEHANQAKTEFLARVSHEVRTHLNSILGISYIAQQQEYNNQSPLNRINRVASYMHGIVNDMLDIDRLEKNQLQLNNESFYLDDVLDKLITVMSHRVEEKGLNFTVKFPNVILPALIGDPLRIEQLLSNLLTNAIKHTETGNIGLNVYLRQSDTRTEQSSLCFDITDTGNGIAEYAIEGELNTQTTQSLNFGIGLKLCHQLAKLMQGKLYVKSTPREGSCFTFSLTLDSLQHGDTNNHSLYVEPQEVLLITPNIDAMSPTLKQVRSQLQLLKYTVHQCTVDQFQAYDLRPITTLIVDETALLSQDQLLQQLIKHDHLRMFLLLPQASVFPHWLSTLGYKQRLNYPCSARHLSQSLMVEDKLQTQQTNALLSDEYQPNHSNYALVVDDDEINQEIVTELLHSVGIKVDVAGNGLQAIEAVKSKSYQLVLMDIEMPVMGGEQALKEIRMLGEEHPYQHLKSLPIIALTAHALLDDKKRFLLAGMSDYIVKPVEPSTLIKVVNHWLTHPTVLSQTSTELVQAPTAPIIIADINTPSGLERCNGNRTLYKKILRQFAQQYKDGLFIEGKSNEQLKQLAHSIKGTAANIGATKLNHLAKSLEKALIESQPIDRIRFVTFNDTVIQTCERIFSYLSSQHDDTHKDDDNSLPKEELMVRLQTLSAMLDDDHGAAFTLLEELKGLNEPSLIDIESAMNSFDSELAKKLTQSWINKLDVT